MKRGKWGPGKKGRAKPDARFNKGGHESSSDS